MEKINKLWKLMFLYIVLLISTNAIGQSMSNYAFSTATNGSLTDMSTGTTQLIGASLDNTASTVTSIGFNFVFMGVPYTQFSVNDDGQMRLGSTQISAFAVTSPSSNIPYIVPFGLGNKTSATGQVYYKLSGTTPNQILTVEWKDLNINATGTNTSAYSTFQVRLYEATGAIEFVYGRMFVNSTSSVSPYFFISSNSSSGTIGAITSVNTIPAFNNTTTFPSSTTFTAATDMANLNSTADGSRRIFTFTPPTAPLAPTGFSITNAKTSGMYLNWTDNATNETNYLVYKSTDGTNYSLAATLASNVTSYYASGLTPSTTYYWKIYAVNEGMMSSSVGGNQATTAITAMSGAYTVGTTGTYKILTEAFSEITVNGFSGPVQLEILADYDAFIEPAFPVAVPKNATNTNTLTIYPKVTGVVMNPTSQALGYLNFDGSKYVTIDGRVGGTGSAIDMVVKQPGLSNYVIQFINDASNNTIQYCTIQGGCNTSTIGLINFSTTNGTTGNDNNLIDNCNIAPSVVSYTTGIYSSGTSGKENSGNTISNCNIYNFRSSASNSNGIYLASYNTDWTIKGNSFYQTGTGYQAYVYTTYGINITSGNNHIIENNYIGGNSASCGGTWTVNGTMAGSKFVGIYLSVGITTATSVQNNTIKNFSWWTTSGSSAVPGVWCGIYLTSGNANIGTITGNTIGSDTGTGSINIGVSNTSTPAIVYGIVSSGTTYSISNNRIGSITSSSINTSGGATTTSSVGIIGIATSGNGAATITSNTIGSLTDANSINASSASTATIGQAVIGIWHAATISSIITKNNIANLNNAYAGTGSGTVLSQIRGILVGNVLTTSVSTTNSVNTITENKIFNLSIASPYTGTTSTASAIGVSVLSGSGNQNISQNSIYNISSTSTTGSVSLIGMYLKLPTSVTNTIERNKIYNLTLTTSGAGVIAGLQIGFGGTNNCLNNIITLGNGLSNSYTITGIDESGATSNFYFNSVYIGGISVVGTASTYVLNSSVTSNTRNYKNNIFVNARSNGTGTGKHYGIKISGTLPNPSGLSSDYNIVYTPGTGGVFGFCTADRADLQAWKDNIGANNDRNSISADPKFVDPTATTPDMHLQLNTPADIAGIDIASITNDYFGNVRADLTPTDIGAHAGNFDGVAPTITTFDPVNNATNVPIGSTIKFTFSEKIRKTDNSAIDATVISFKKTSDNSNVAFTITYDDVAKILTVTPISVLIAYTEYKITVTGVEDFNDNALSGTDNVTFTSGTDDSSAPIFSSASVENANPNNVVIVFNENVKYTDKMGFVVKVGGNAATINSISGTGSKNITLVLATAITTHQTVTVEYAGGNVTDIVGNVLADFTAQTVTNNTKSSAKDFLTFSVLKSNNTSLTGDVTGVIGTNSVDLFVPAGTDRSSLIPSFTTSNYVAKVEIGTTIQTSGTTANNFTTSLTYKVTAEDNTTKDYTVNIYFIQNIPYNQGFDVLYTLPSDWTYKNAGTGSSWNISGTYQGGTGSLYYFSHATNAANAWAFSPSFNLINGKKYVIEFFEKVSYSGNPNKLKVTIGNAPQVDLQTNELWKDENLTNTNWIQQKINYTCTADGIYNVAINCYSNANQYNLYVDEFKIREQGTDATLSEIKYNNTVVPDFNASTLTYNVELPYGTTIIPTVTATSTDVNATKVITQATSVTGTATIEVTADDGTTKKTYNVVFSVGKNPDATLSDIKIDNNSVANFASSTFTYNVELAYGTTTAPTVTATTTNVNATKVITPATSLPGNTTIEVTAENGATKKTYTIVFSVAKNNVATLTDLKIDNVTIANFSSATLSYDVELPFGTTIVPTITATTTDANASKSITPATALPGSSTIIVTAEDGITKKTYTVNFTLGKSNIATLSEIKVDNVTITSFVPTLYSYEVKLPFGTTIVPVVTATTSDAKATKIITSATSIPGSTSIEVTAEDGVKKQTYSVNFSLGKSNIATLSDIKVNGTTITGFASSTYAYQVTLPYGTTTIPVVAATTTDANAIKVLTQPISVTGTATIEITAEDGITKQTYTLNFVVAKNNVATLSDLKVNGTTVTGFSASTLTYNVVLAYGTTAIPTVTATTTDINAAKVITNAAALPGSTTILVTAEDGTTKKTYTINFTVAKNNVATLSDLKINGSTVAGFNSSTLIYSFELPYGTTTVPTVTAITGDINATKIITNATALPGSTTIVVTAEDGITKQTYTINFTVAGVKNAIATLSDLQVNGVTIVGFSSTVLNYNVELPYGTTDIPVVTATTTDIKATKVIIQATSVNGIATVGVTAEDGTTKKEYSISFKVAKNSDATLSEIKVGNNPVSNFAKETYTYYVELPYGIAIIPEVTAKTTDVLATKVITQASNLSGTEEERTALIEVIAENGSTKLSYSVVFSIAKSNISTLSDLKVNNNTVAGFSASTYTYNVVLPVGTTVVPVVSATTADAKATKVITQAISVNGTATVDVTAENGISKKTYTITFTTQKNSDATLSDIKVNGISIVNFAATTLNYNVELPYGTTQNPVVTASTTDVNATKVLTQATSVNGNAKIEVTAEDGNTIQIYTVNFTVAKNNATEILTFTLPGQIGNSVINSTNRTVEIVMPSGFSHNQIATFTLSNGANAKVNNVSQVSGTTSNDFTNAIVYVVTAENGTNSQNWTVTVQFVTAIDNINADENISVYPNPSTGVFNVKTSENSSIIILDLNGKVVLSNLDKETNKQFDITNLSNGLYFIRIIQKGKICTKTLVKE